MAVILEDEDMDSQHEEKISGSVMFLTTGKEMWYTLKVMYGNARGCLRYMSACLSSNRENLCLSSMTNSNVLLIS